jgi:hypothetical protein
MPMAPSFALRWHAVPRRQSENAIYSTIYLCLFYAFVPSFAATS